MKTVYIASCSWGKDSIAMLLHCIRNRQKYPIDCVIFVNTGMEFDCIYRMRDKMLPVLHLVGIRYVEIDISEEFKHFMFFKEIKNRDGSGWHTGYRWCGGVCRWGTALKMDAISKFIRETYPRGEFAVVQYVGYAADEMYRTERDTAKAGCKVFPLVEEGITEAEALRMCYESGYTFPEESSFGKVRLYDYLDRASCWCCRNKNLKELNYLYYFFPQYWKKLRELQGYFSDDPMKGPGRSIFDLEERFRKRGASMTLKMFAEG